MLQSSNTELKNVTKRYLSLLDARITPQTLLRDLEESPHYPSLFCLTEVFNRYNIENAAYEINSSEFEKLEPPFLALIHAPQNQKDFVLVKAVSAKRVHYTHVGRKTMQMDLEEFVHRFQNIVWAAETIGQSGEPDFEKNKRFARQKDFLFRSKLVIGVLMLMYLAYTKCPIGHATPYISFLLLLGAGLTVSALLVAYDINRDNPFTKNICSLGKKTNCEAVLSSRAAKIRNISWSEIGLIYFLSQLLFVLGTTISFHDKLAVITWVSTCAAPYIFFSLYYQKKIIKQLCPLCLGIQAVLLLLFFVGIFYYWMQPYMIVMESTVIASVLFSVAFPLITWGIIRPLLDKAKGYDIYKPAYKRLHYNRKVFETNLLQQPVIIDGWSDLGITIGNQGAVNTIVKVCNPYCTPCARAHQQLAKLVELKKNLCVKVIFLATNDDQDKRGKIVKHFLSLYRANDNSIHQILCDWYLAQIRNYQTFAEKYPISADLNQEHNSIEMMSEWCKKAGITHTPTIFLNGYLMPEAYTLDDLELLL